MKVIGDGSRVYLEERHEVKHSIPTYQKSIDILGFEHKKDLEEGSNQNVGMENNNQKEKDLFGPFYELDKGIYSYWKNDN